MDEIEQAELVSIIKDNMALVDRLIGLRNGVQQMSLRADVDIPDTQTAKDLARDVMGINAYYIMMDDARKALASYGLQDYIDEAEVE